MSLKITDFYQNSFSTASDGSEALKRSELLRNEAFIENALRRFIAFENCSVYFPQSPLLAVEALVEEKRLLVPLCQGDHWLGALQMNGVDMHGAEKIAPYLTDILSLCLANIQLREGQYKDRKTGLLLESAFLEMVGARFGALEIEGPSLGMAVFIWPHARNAQRYMDAADFENLRVGLATALQEQMSQDALVARLDWIHGRQEFGVVFQSGGRGSLHKRVRSLQSALMRILMEHDLARYGLPAVVLAGHTLYPQDFRGNELRAPLLERARLMRDKARLAAELAWDAEHLSVPVLGYAWISSQAGKIIELLDSTFVRINLGSTANVLQGDRFHVIHAGDPRTFENSRAQLVVRVLGEKDSKAQIMHVDEPARPPAVGDMIVPSCAAWPAFEDDGILISQKRFMEKFALARKGCASYCLAITRFSLLPKAERFIGPPQEFRRSLNRFLRSSFFTSLKAGLTGWYGGAAIIMFMPEVKAKEGLELCAKLHERAKSGGFETATGLFAYPYLNFRRSDSEACALKALAYGELLPEPHIGVLDHLALTISADHRFSEGDEMGAMEEYRLALLVKPDDPGILNSLGVCLGALNRNEDAIELFLKALHNCDDNLLASKIYYNLGTIYEKENEFSNARACFRQCIKHVPDHIYSWIRLGRIHAKTGRVAGAQALYHYAWRLAEIQPQLKNVVERHLARLTNNGNQTEKVREMLHDALLRDPSDGESLLLLAQTYLEDDPAMAENLARRCLRLGIDAWNTLADALAALGKNEDAVRVRNCRG